MGIDGEGKDAMPGPISQPQTLADVKTLPELLRWRVEATPAAEAYRHFDAHAGRWVSQSWHEIDAEFELWRRALAAENFSPGERVAILMPNGIAHIAMDQASLSRGLVPVPMHAVDNPDSIAYILADSGALLLFVDTLARWQAIVATGQPLDALKRIVCADMTGPVPADARIVALDQWLASAPGATAPLIIAAGALERVRERQEGQEDVVGRRRDAMRDRLHIGDNVVMRQHHALRPPGRARGVDDGGKIVRRHRDVGQWRGRARRGRKPLVERDDACIGRHRSGHVGTDDALERIERLAGGHDRLPARQRIDEQQ
jgi:hypothetical protein